MPKIARPSIESKRKRLAHLGKQLIKKEKANLLSQSPASRFEVLIIKKMLKGDVVIEEYTDKQRKEVEAALNHIEDGRKESQKDWKEIENLRTETKKLIAEMQM